MVIVGGGAERTMNLDTKTLTSARQALREAVRGWIYDPNVRLIDFGWPEHGGTLVEDELAIRIHVTEKIAQGPMLEAAAREGVTRGPIPNSIGGFPVDVPQGAYRLHRWWQPPTPPRARRAEPMRGGISVANGRIRGYATLGGAVIDRETGAKMILSNWHVLVGSWWMRPGSPIYQPGPGDGGTDADTVARLSRDAMAANLDAAVAELTGARTLINDQFDLGPVKGVSWAEPGMAVTKSGRASGITRGRVAGVEGTARLPYSGVYRLIRNVMTIDPREEVSQVSTGGDSGSWWLEEETMNVVGLHFAGSDSPERGLAIDMQPILDALKWTWPSAVTRQRWRTGEVMPKCKPSLW
jgi:endonuclease G